jgi:hypothetical protein
MFEQIWRKSNSYQIEFDLHLNKSMKNEKLYYSFRPHCSPRPQWLAGLKSSPERLNSWPLVVPCCRVVRPAHGWRVVTAQCVSSVRGTMRCSPAFQWLIGDEVLTYTFYN